MTGDLVKDQKVLINFNDIEEKPDVNKEYRKQKHDILYYKKHICLRCYRKKSIVNYYSKIENIAYNICNVCYKKEKDLKLIMSVLNKIDLDI